MTDKSNDGNVRADKSAELDVYQGLTKLYLERADLLYEIGRLLEQAPSRDIHKALRRLKAHDRHFARYLKKIEKLN
jgi:hypothetical protein